MSVQSYGGVTTTGDITYHHSIKQGSKEWHDLRRGILTASTMGCVITPSKLAMANNEETRTVIYNLASERVSNVPADMFMSYAMERGHLEEAEARIVYRREYQEISECGFITNERLGFKVGFSPDGLVGDEGFIEVKSRASKFQMKTIIEHIAPPDPLSAIPKEYMLQVQTGLWVTGREWCDFISYSNGMNMAVVRVEPNPTYQDAISEAANVTEQKIQDVVERYKAAISDGKNRITPVKWIDHHEDITA